jgi:hypothetical protein
VDRQRPDTTSNEIELYIRTYYSMLRSTGEVRVRSFEEPHAFSKASLHLGARRLAPDIAAFGYAAMRLPACMPEVKRLVLGQSEEQFVGYGYNVRDWQRVSTRGRRRPIRWDGNDTLAVFISSASDIDDLVPLVTAYQIEWNKMHALLAPSTLASRLTRPGESLPLAELHAELCRVLELPGDRIDKLLAALGERYLESLAILAATRADLRLRLLAASFSQYQRAAQRWWSGIEPIYLQEREPRRRPVYFVSSNTHSLVNLLGGYALAHKEELLETAKLESSPEFQRDLERALAEDRDEAPNYLYFVLRQHLRAQPERQGAVQAWDAESGIATAPDPGRIEVSAQVIELAKLSPARFDPRLVVPGLERLAASNALIINIDYPLGMAAYQLLSRLGQGVGSLGGVFVMGKAATLNARVGDVLLSSAVFDEHSKSTYVMHNAFNAGDIAPYLKYGSVLDNQKVLTVRGTFLQNRNYMGVFYKEGYTVMEMEAGPYLSAIYELVDPRRHPIDEIVYLSDRTPFPVGLSRSCRAAYRTLAWTRPTPVRSPSFGASWSSRLRDCPAPRPLREKPAARLANLQESCFT